MSYIFSPLPTFSTPSPSTLSLDPHTLNLFGRSLTVIFKILNICILVICNKDNDLLRSDQQIWQTQWQPDHTSWDGDCISAGFKKVGLRVWGDQADINRVSKTHGKWNHHCSQEGKWSEHTEPRKEEAVPFAVASHRIKYIDFNLTKVLKTCTLQIGKYCCRKEYINKWKSILYSLVGM